MRVLFYIFNKKVVKLPRKIEKETETMEGLSDIYKISRILVLDESVGNKTS